MSNYTGAVPDSEPAPDWRGQAVCREIRDDTFFPKPGNTPAINHAKEICAGCPVQRACLVEALREEGGRVRENRFGVRGGRTPGQRFAMYMAYRKRQQRSSA